MKSVVGRLVPGEDWENKLNLNPIEHNLYDIQQFLELYDLSIELTT